MHTFCERIKLSAFATRAQGIAPGHHRSKQNAACTEIRNQYNSTPGCHPRAAYASTPDSAWADELRAECKKCKKSHAPHKIHLVSRSHIEREHVTSFVYACDEGKGVKALAQVSVISWLEQLKAV